MSPELKGLGHREIRFIANQPALFTRSESFFENNAFDDEELWSKTGIVERRKFVDRLTRSVVWQPVTDLLATASNLKIVPGRATNLRVNTEPGPPLTVIVQPGDPSSPVLEVDADLVVDATGFDTVWFRELLPDPYNSWDEQTWKDHGLLMDPAV